MIEKSEFERYRLTLHHEYLGADGGCTNIERPIVAMVTIAHNEMFVPTGVVIDELIDRLKIFILQQVKEREG